MGTSIERSSATTELCMRGASFAIPGEAVDGMDVRAVVDAGRRATERARQGGGPFILEMKTYRYRGHSMSDPAKYRTREEVDQIRTQRDPIELVKGVLAEAGIGADRLKPIDDEVKGIVAEAVSYAQSSPEPDPSELYTDVYLEA
jgi:pyruvate dehydrogenase E1 component alpha subunit